MAEKKTVKKTAKKTTKKAEPTENKTLVIVESPAKAKTIEKYLGKKYKVIASKGHLRDLPKSQIGVDIENGFEPKYINIRGKGDLIKQIKKDAEKYPKIYLATDLDREGEAISWHLSKLLDIDEDKECRIVFNEITKDAIQNAVKHPRKINTDLVNAQQARRILDRIVGYKLSPLLWAKINRKGLSAGRVQSVALKLIVDRENEIQNFVPEEYWTLDADVKDQKKNKFTINFYGDKKGKIKLQNKERVDGIIKDLDQKEYVVSDKKLGVRKKNAPPPFITSSLQQEAARKLNYTAKRTMMIAQELYEGVNIKGEGHVGLITYMRTDSTRISEEGRNAARAYILNQYGKEYVYYGKASAPKGANVADAHEAIRPTLPLRSPETVKDSLKPEAFKLYSLVWNRFLASQMMPAVYDTVALTVDAGDYVFKASGSEIKFKGFMAAYVEGQDNKEEKEQKIPKDLEIGEILTLQKLKPEQHFTQPPPRFTEAMLIKMLEEKGIGRPSTYAPTIDTLQNRQYVYKEQKRFVPTELGEVVTELMKENFKDIVNVKFTANMEKELDEIEENKQDWKEILQGFYDKFKVDLEKAESTVEKIQIKDEETDVICEKCGRKMVIKNGRFGKFLACPGFPECRNTKPYTEKTDIPCPKCKDGKIIVRKTKTGRNFYGCSNYPECDFTSWKKPSGKYCPVCGSYMIRERNKLVCSNKKCGKEGNSGV